MIPHEQAARMIRTIAAFVVVFGQLQVGASHSYVVHQSQCFRLYLPPGHPRSSYQLPFLSFFYLCPEWADWTKVPALGHTFQIGS
jgi:hypothetical protein